jgi:hypothetical protein
MEVSPNLRIKMNTHADNFAEAVKVAPPITISFVSMAGFTISDFTYAVTALYTVIMICQHAWEKWVKPWRKNRK